MLLKVSLSIVALLALVALVEVLRVPFHALHLDTSFARFTSANNHDYREENDEKKARIWAADYCK